jgi:hypothetical protein
MLIGLFVVYHINRGGRLFSVPVLFNGYAALYFVLGIYYYSDLVYGGGSSYELDLILSLCFFAIIFFNVGYVLVSNGYAKIPTAKGYVGWVPRTDTLILVVIVALMAEFFVILIVGPYNYFFIDRLSRFPIMKHYQSILYIANLMNIALPFIFARYFLTKSSLDKKLLFFVLAHNLFFAVLLISRSSLAYNFICIFFFLELHGHVKRSTLIISGLLMSILMFFYKGFLYGVILDKDYEKFNPGEFINWIRNSEIMLSNGYDYTYLPNNSYLLALKSLFIISPDDDALSEWFISEFYSDRVVSGLTYGFSGLIEGYLYIGVLGVVIHFFGVGVLFGLLERLRGSFRLAISIFVMFIMFRVFRSEIYNFIKTFSWFYFYQAIAIVIIDTIIKWYRTNNIVWKK